MGVLVRELGFIYVLLFSEVMFMVRIVFRGYTVCVDVYFIFII